MGRTKPLHSDDSIRFSESCNAEIDVATFRSGIEVKTIFGLVEKLVQYHLSCARGTLFRELLRVLGALPHRPAGRLILYKTRG